MANMNPSSGQIDTSKFLQAIRACRPLWDPSEQGYRTRRTKRCEWTKIAKYFKISEMQACHKWFYLYNKYKKEREKSTPTWHLFEEMNFLEKQFNYVSPLAKSNDEINMELTKFGATIPTKRAQPRARTERSQSFLIDQRSIQQSSTQNNYKTVSTVPSTSPVILNSSASNQNVRHGGIAAIQRSPVVKTKIDIESPKQQTDSIETRSIRSPRSQPIILNASLGTKSPVQLTFQTSTVHVSKTNNNNNSSNNNNKKPSQKLPVKSPVIKSVQKLSIPKKSDIESNNENLKDNEFEFDFMSNGNNDYDAVIGGGNNLSMDCDAEMAENDVESDYKIRCRSFGTYLGEELCMLNKSTGDALIIDILKIILEEKSKQYNEK